MASDSGVRQLVQTSRRVTECQFDELRSRWQLTTESGARYESDAVVLATGQLNRPSLPNLPGAPIRSQLVRAGRDGSVNVGLAALSLEGARMD